MNNRLINILLLLFPAVFLPITAFAMETVNAPKDGATYSQQLTVLEEKPLPKKPSFIQHSAPLGAEGKKEEESSESPIKQLPNHLQALSKKEKDTAAQKASNRNQWIHNLEKIWATKANNNIFFALKALAPDNQKEITSYVDSKLPLFENISRFALAQNATESPRLHASNLGAKISDAIVVEKDIAYIGCLDGSIIQYDLKKKEKISQSTPSIPHAVTALAINTKWLAIGYANGTIEIYDRKTNRVQTSIQRGFKIDALALADNDQCADINLKLQHIYIHNIITGGQVTSSFIGEVSPAYDVELLFDGKKIITTIYNNLFNDINADSNILLHRIENGSFIEKSISVLTSYVSMRQHIGKNYRKELAQTNFNKQVSLPDFTKHYEKNLVLSNFIYDVFKYAFISIMPIELLFNYFPILNNNPILNNKMSKSILSSSIGATCLYLLPLNYDIINPIHLVNHDAVDLPLFLHRSFIGTDLLIPSLDNSTVLNKQKFFWIKKAKIMSGKLIITETNNTFKIIDLIAPFEKLRNFYQSSLEIAEWELMHKLNEASIKKIKIALKPHEQEVYQKIISKIEHYFGVETSEKTDEFLKKYITNEWVIKTACTIV